MVGTLKVVWHGTPEEAMDLVNALNNNCQCVFNDGVRTATCASHRALVEDQRFVDGLITYRHMKDKLFREEFLAKP